MHWIKGQKIIDILRNKKVKNRLSNNNNNNNNNIIVNENEEPYTSDKVFVNFKDNSQNNKIVIHSSVFFAETGRIIIDINGNSNYVEIGKDCRIFSSVTFSIGGDNNHIVKNVKFIIGENNYFSQVSLNTVNSNTSIQIGNDNMFSSSVELYNTDGHPIYNSKGEIINRVKDIVIGNKCWIGWGVVILKNTKIPNGTIVGKSSVVSGNKLSKENCAIAGNPAKVIKEEVFWNVYDKNYIENEL